VDHMPGTVQAGFITAAAITPRATAGGIQAAWDRPIAVGIIGMSAQAMRMGGTSR